MTGNIDKKLDMSLGDPLESFDFLARAAFERSLAQNHKYQIWGPDNEYMKALYRTVQSFLQTRGFKSDGWCGIPNCDLLFTGGGTTSAYGMIIEHLMSDVRKENVRRNDEGQIKPVILMPTPTYGMFFPQPEKQGLEIVKIPRELSNGGALNIRQVHDVIEGLRESGKRVIAYYDSNPHNPLGIIRGEEETRKLATLFNHHSRQYAELDGEAERYSVSTTKEEISSQAMDNILGNARMTWRGPASRIRMIDDMVYWGLEYDPAHQPYSFAMVDGESYKNTFVLLGPSKAGMAAARAGLIYAHRDDISEINRRQVESIYAPTGYTMEVLSGYFNSDETAQAQRWQYLESLNAKHEFAGKFMKALINGAKDKTIDLRPDEYNKMLDLLTMHKNLTKQQAVARLARGIDGVRVLTSPKAGFFHMLDFSALAGRGYHKTFPNGTETQLEIKEEWSIRNLFQQVNVMAASGVWMGLDIEDMKVRVTFALPAEDIIEFADRMQALVDLSSPMQTVAGTELKRKYAP